MKVRIAMALLCGTLLIPVSASAEQGFASTSVNLRAGPGTGYPVIAVIPGGARVNIVGCLSNYAWCDVAWGRNRGMGLWALPSGPRDVALGSPEPGAVRHDRFQF